jgi:hypothetical protein
MDTLSYLELKGQSINSRNGKQKSLIVKSVGSNCSTFSTINLYSKQPSVLRLKGKCTVHPKGNKGRRNWDVYFEILRFLIYAGLRKTAKAFTPPPLK